MESGIYKIYCSVTDMIYIGKSKNIEQRLKTHIQQLRANKHINIILQTDFNEYGEESFSFEPIHYCDEEFMTPLENYFIEKFNTTKNGYNINNVNISSHLKREKRLLEKNLYEKQEKLLKEKKDEEIRLLINGLKDMEIINISELNINRRELNFYLFICESPFLQEVVYGDLSNDITFPDNIEKLLDKLSHYYQEVSYDLYVYLKNEISIQVNKKYKDIASKNIDCEIDVEDGQIYLSFHIESTYKDSYGVVRNESIENKVKVVFN